MAINNFSRFWVYTFENMNGKFHNNYTRCSFIARVLLNSRRVWINNDVSKHSHSESSPKFDVCTSTSVAGAACAGGKYWFFPFNMFGKKICNTNIVIQRVREWKHTHRFNMQFIWIVIARTVLRQKHTSDNVKLKWIFCIMPHDKRDEGVPPHIQNPDRRSI